MNKVIIPVPHGVRYISQWPDFSFRGMFPGPCIIDKVIPGCGMTSQAILGPEPAIICSPRRMLLLNKHEQHQDPKNGFTYLVVNDSEEFPDIEKVLGKTKRSSSSSVVNLKDWANSVEKTYEDQLLNEENERRLRISEERVKFSDRLRKELTEYLGHCYKLSSDCFNATGTYIYPKILVTYDSFKVVRAILEEKGIMQDFTIFVDEFQAILSDARFKSDTELSFLTNLRGLDKVYFVSATPMMDKYLSEIPEFKDLTLYKFDWETLQPGRLTKPNLIAKSTTRLSRVIDRIIESYRSRKFEEVLYNGKLVLSMEAVIYVNSVDMILNTIKRNNLTPGEVNILCADTPNNRARVKKSLGKSFYIGRVPLRGEPRKMFTFCTRTVYLGADFYSDNARSFIFSDSNRDYLSVDISLDLPQILGRQRLLENPWKNSAEFYYLPTLVEGNSREELASFQLEKEEATKLMLSMYSSITDERARGLLAARLQNYIVSKNYSEDYISVNITADCTGRLSLTPVYNYLVKLSEQRAFDIQQVDYRDRFSVAECITNSVNSGQQSAPIEDLVYLDFLRKEGSCTTFSERAKLLCETGLTDNHRDHYISTLPVTDPLRTAYETLGIDTIKGYSYSLSRLKQVMNKKNFSLDSLKQEFRSTFKVDQVILSSDLKNIIRSIYESIGYKGSPKATDILNYFTVKKVLVQVTDPDGNKKRAEAYKIISPL